MLLKMHSLGLFSLWQAPTLSFKDTSGCTHIFLHAAGERQCSGSACSTPFAFYYINLARRSLSLGC